MPAAVIAEPEPPIPAQASASSGAIEIEFATGARMRIAGAVDAATVTAVVAALSDGPRRR